MLFAIIQAGHRLFARECPDRFRITSHDWQRQDIQGRAPPNPTDNSEEAHTADTANPTDNSEEADTKEEGAEAKAATQDDHQQLDLLFLDPS